MYTTKPDSGADKITLTRRGDTATVIDTSKNVAGGTADLAELRAHSPIIPVEGVTADRLVDSFDDPRGGTRRHEAMDIIAPRGARVLSADAGRVLKLHNSVAGGLSIYVADPTQRFIMLYAHLDSYRPGLVEGATVKQGELLGFVGFTGNGSPSAPHLHFAIARSDNSTEWWKGTPLNPFLIYRGKTDDGSRAR